MMYRYAFQSTLPARGATWTTLSISPRRRFQSTLPARGATPQDIKTKNIKADFNPRSPHGERQNGFCTISAKPRISIHAPRTGSDPPFDYNRINAYISIHAPRTGSDSAPAFAPDAAEHFNPRSPHGERLRYVALVGTRRTFQSTLPARGATVHVVDFPLDIGISIHAPRTGSDVFLRLQAFVGLRFQSTLPARGATKPTFVISVTISDFNPRSPHGERRAAFFELQANT